MITFLNFTLPHFITIVLKISYFRTLTVLATLHDAL